MFTTVHNIRIVFLACCALFLLSAPHSVVRSQEETIPASSEVDSQEVVTNESLDSATTTVSEPITPPQPVNPYPIEGIPGGDYVVGDFVVGPGKIDLTIEPGMSRTVEMTVTNRTGERRRFNLTVEDAAGSQDPATSVVLLGDDRGPYSIKDYISLPAKSFELEHNQRARVQVTINVPRNAEPGGLYGSVLVDTVAVDAVPGDGMGTAPQSAIIARIGTLFFVTIPGAVERSGSLIDFTTVPEQTFFQSGPVNFGIYFENTGTMHLAPYGEVSIRNMMGDEVGNVALEPWFVLPQSKRLREVTWNRELLFGRYVATVQVNRGYDDIIDTESFTFWVLPWKIVLGAFALVFLVVFIIRAFFRTFEFKRKR